MSDSTVELTTLGERIRYIRKEKELSQKEISIIMTTSQSYMSRVEVANEIPTDMFIKLFCLIFKINEKWLTSGEGAIHLDESPHVHYLKLLSGDILDSLNDMQKLISAFQESLKEILKNLD